MEREDGAERTNQYNRIHARQPFFSSPTPGPYPLYNPHRILKPQRALYLPDFLHPLEDVCSVVPGPEGEEEVRCSFRCVLRARGAEVSDGIGGRNGAEMELVRTSCTQCPTSVKTSS